jgi:protein-disulfide isomerase
VLGQYPKDVKLVFKNFPLQNHAYAMKAATAALAAQSEGKFWELHDLLFKNYNQLNDKKVKEIVKELDLNEKEFEKKMADPQIIQKVRQDSMDGIAAGVNGTPTLFINGKLLRNRSLEGFKEIIEKELVKAKRNK